MTASAAGSFWSGRSTPANVLVIVTRRIGDVLLATPLVRSLKLAWPDTTIDALVFSGTEAIIAANPDLRQIHTIPPRSPLSTHLRLLGRIARRYELALSLVPSDRPTLYAFVAGRTRAGLLLDTPKEQWKRPFLHRWVPFDPLNTHTVRMHLSLADLLGVTVRADPVVTWQAQDAAQVNHLMGPDAQASAVLHLYPKFNYKMWAPEAWVGLASWLGAHGYRVVLTGGNEDGEVRYVTQLARHMPANTVNAAGRLTLGASACLISRARLYVGPDTALTHVAAALGVPTIALYGPTDPVKWGPWPRGHPPTRNPWRRHGSQQSGNVTLLQGVGPCVPCLNEGCGSNVASFSDCLRELQVSKVCDAIDAALAWESQAPMATAST